METKFENNTIFGGILNGAIIGDHNIVQQEHTKNDCFIEGLDEVLKHAKDKTEQECARKAKELYVSDKKSLKDFIIDNLSTFTTGTFATVSGGLLLAAIKNILKMS